MARLNRPAPRPQTHEGASADRTTPYQQLRRSVLACMLWERQFYEDGEEIAERIRRLVPQCTVLEVGELALEARTRFKLRHVPLWIAACMDAAGGQHRAKVGHVLAEVIQRPDELCEFVAMCWKDGRKPLGASVKRGLRRAFGKFNAYSLAKYDRAGEVKLRDVLRIVHPSPRDEEQSETWRKLIAGELESPDTWEVALSKGGVKTLEEKRVIWERLLSERKLGALALLRNLRNMTQAGVPQVEIEKALGEARTDRVLPFRFISAAKAAPNLEPALEPLMLKCLEERDKLGGHTVLLVDHSGSMVGYGANLSARSDLTRFDAACGLAILAREVCERVTVLCFSNHGWAVPPRRGFALRDALQQGSWGGTYLGAACRGVLENVPCDRLIVFTDEQSHDSIPSIPAGLRAYMVNVASYRNGVGYGNGWNRVDGFSEAILDYIQEIERA